MRSAFPRQPLVATIRPTLQRVADVFGIVGKDRERIGDTDTDGSWEWTGGGQPNFVFPGFDIVCRSL